MNKQNIKKMLTIENGLIAALIIVAIWSNYSIFNTKLLPFTYRMLALAFIDISVLLCIALTLKKMKKNFIYIRRGFIVFLCIILGILSFYLTSINNATKNITSGSKTKTENILVLSLQDSSIEQLDDLSTATIGYQNGVDLDNAEYAMDELEDDLGSLDFTGTNNYIELAQELLDKKIDAFIISEAYVDTLIEAMPEFYAQINKIHSIAREIENTIDYESTQGIDLTKDVFTVLLTASDSKASPDSNGLSDVNMVLIVNPQLNHIEMISLPRDLFVPNIALGSVNDKLTHTGVYGGVENTRDSIENVIGFDLDFYIKINFSSLIKIVDTLGGVDVDIQYAFSEQNSERSFAPEDLITLYPGMQEINGEEALAYSRHRYSEGVGDIGRTKAQQQIIQAIINKTISVEGATKIPTLLNLMGDYVTTNFTEDQVNKFVSYEIENLEAWTTGSTTLENGSGAMLLTASYPSLPLSCMLLNENDIIALYEIYFMHKNPTTFDEFAFNINDLSPITDYQTNQDITYVSSNYEDFLPTIPEDDPIDEVPIPEDEENPIPDPDEDEEDINYTVTFYNMDGTIVLLTVEVIEGGAASPPVAPIIEGYEFSGWDQDFSIINSDLNITAIYTKIDDGGEGELPIAP